jgi:hypothetical protein
MNTSKWDQSRNQRSPQNYHVIKIDGQPMDDDLTKLEYELLAMATSILNTYGGRLHTHNGMICKNAEYGTFSHTSTYFIILTNLGLYPSLWM